MAFHPGEDSTFAARIADGFVIEDFRKSKAM